MSTSHPTRQTLRFGIFQVDLHQRELYKNGFKVRIQEQSFLLLEALLEQPGLIVTREQLRNRLWPADTFVDFDHGLNAAMKRLRDTLGDDADNPRFIETIPKRGYRFLALTPVQPVRPEPGDAAVPLDQATARAKLPVPVVGIFFLVALAAFVTMHYAQRSGAKVVGPASRLLPLTTYPGAESAPAFSGDGDQVAFVWDGDTPTSTNIYVKHIGVDPPLQLTHGSGLVCCPTWTPDNRYVAYEHCSGANQGIYVLPALGGSERKLRNGGGCNGISWSPNEQILAFSDKNSNDSPWGLFLMSSDNLQPHQLTFPEADSIGDQNPTFSPDGKSIAFIRIVGEGTTDVYTVAVLGGPIRRITFDNTYVMGVSWTADGKSLVFSSHREGDQSLWVVSANGGTPRRLPLGSSDATDPAVSRQSNLLSFTQGSIHPNLWKIEISRNAATQHPQARPLLPSATYNNSPQFSPDGKTLAFTSLRSGEMEIWVCPIEDCANPQQLTFLKSLTGTPRWSPDGTRISFESRPSRHSQIFVVNAGGGKPLALTDATAEDKVSSWSPDGKFVYFSSNRRGVAEIWKVPSSGGQPVQVTRHGGFASFASSDGRFLYYVKSDEPGIWRMLTTGGEEALVVPELPAVYWGDWALKNDGVYYVSETGPKPEIKFLDFKTRKTSPVAEVDSLPPPGDPGFTISPDEKHAVFSQVDRSAVDLMLVEHFSAER